MNRNWLKSITVAEWATLLLSSALLVAVLGYLVFRVFQSDSPKVALEISVLKEEATQKDSGWIVPIEIENKNRSSIEQLSLEIPGGQYELDYLPGQGKQKIFIFVASEDEMKGLKVKPLAYRAE